EQQLVARTHAIAVLAVARSEEAAPPRAAVLADAAQWFDDHRFLRDALLDRRQLAGLDEIGERGRLVELLRPLRRIGDDLRVLELADQPGLRQIALRQCARGAGQQRSQGDQGLPHRRLPLVTQATPASVSSAAR